MSFGEWIADRLLRPAKELGRRMSGRTRVEADFADLKRELLEQILRGQAELGEALEARAMLHHRGQERAMLGQARLHGDLQASLALQQAALEGINQARAEITQARAEIIETSAKPNVDSISEKIDYLLQAVFSTSEKVDIFLGGIPLLNGLSEKLDLCLKETLLLTAISAKADLCLKEVLPISQLSNKVDDSLRRLAYLKDLMQTEVSSEINRLDSYLNYHSQSTRQLISDELRKLHASSQDHMP